MVTTNQNGHAPVDAPSVRPARLADYAGQDAIKDQISVRMTAARMRGEALDHCVMYGPPGLGKTTLAEVIAGEMGGKLVRASGPAIERPGDLAQMLCGLAAGDLLFIDEIHRLAVPVQETLYTAMEDFRIELVVGKAPAARAISLELPRFTLLGATTHMGKLAGPLRDRFGIQLRLEFYPAEVLAGIASRTAEILGCPLTMHAAQTVGARSRGTPRVANRLTRALRDYAAVLGVSLVDEPLACSALELMGVDRAGLNATDRRILHAVCTQAGGGPVGLETLEAATGEATETIAEAVEPYLMALGLMTRTRSGRVATRAAYAHLGLPVPLTAAY